MHNDTFFIGLCDSVVAPDGERVQTDAWYDREMFIRPTSLDDHVALIYVPVDRNGAAISASGPAVINSHFRDLMFDGFLPVAAYDECVVTLSAYLRGRRDHVVTMS